MRITAIICVLLITMASAVWAAAPCAGCGGCSDKQCKPVSCDECEPPKGECCDDPWLKEFTLIPTLDCVSSRPSADCCLGSEFCLLKTICWDLEYDTCCQPSEYRLLCKPVRTCESQCSRPKCRQNTCTPAPRCSVPDPTQGIDIG